MKKTLIPIFGFFLLSIILMIQSCAKDETLPTAEAKSFTIKKLDRSTANTPSNKGAQTSARTSSLQGIYFDAEIADKKGKSRTYRLLALPTSDYVATLQTLNAKGDYTAIIKGFKGLLIAHDPVTNKFAFGGMFDKGQWRGDVTTQSGGNQAARESYSDIETYTVTYIEYTDWYQFVSSPGGGGSWVYIGTTSTSYTVTYYVTVYSGGSTGGIDSGGGAGGGGYTAVATNSAAIPSVVPTLDPINDMRDFLKCFDRSKSAIINIYALQPVQNSEVPYSGFLQPNVGHSFVSIIQSGVTGENISSLGFYPNSGVKPLLPTTGGQMGDDGGHAYHVGVSKIVTATQLGQILDYAINYPSTYHLNNYNCTDFAIKIGNLAGLNIPDCYGSWLGGGGSNPGALGQYLRNMESSNIVKSIAPENMTYLADPNSRSCVLD